MPRTRTLTIEHITLSRVERQLRAPLERAGGRIERRMGIQVALCDVSGVCGYGEALPLPSAGTEPMHEVADAVLRTRHDLTGASCTLEELLYVLETRLASQPATRCAFDVAAHDLESRLHGVPVAARLAAEPAGRISVNALIGALDRAACVREAEHAVARGYRTLKLKLGAASRGVDVERVGEVRRAVGPDVRLRVDANGAWSRREALEVLDRLAPLDIELAEQPTDPHALDDLAHVHAHSPIPIAADESLAMPEGRARLLCGDLARIAVIKPMVQGGLHASAELCRRATARGLRIVVTTTLDGPLGTAAALHLAAACGSPTLAHGLASCDVVEMTFPDWLVPHHGQLALDLKPGLGEVA